MDLKTILFNKEGPIATVVLNRPASLNALNSTLIQELDRVVNDISQDRNIRAVIFTGGEKVFAAGADLTEIINIKTPLEARSYVSKVQALFNKIENLEQPTIAAIAGFAFGGGCELALVCDIRIAAGNAQFALPEIKLGLLPGAGGTQRLPRLIGAGPAKEHLFSGDPFSAQEGYRIGLVNKLVLTDSLMQEAEKTAKSLTQRPGFAISTIKGLVNEGLTMPLQSALAHEMRCFETLFQTLDKQEGVSAFLEKRQPEFQHR